ncbi:hypothetical protein C4K37_5616 [Pseudomonas chlororaphis subsp. piscium]|nr:hypothetical protein C4K37_5616 [Pseudomonas chlororaphis subsp. piscium]AZC46534.1 hypothetical protein C4K36_5635 [Pseudomonas chlororaphis subsp. piscium]AZC65706.1 hypothetical protein C4K33_5240 [Pseudomonas chlororaphis subsp. piscium]AZC84496.1 hypothetical protein C4K30_5408 [Pseudomonas chlororaphis subsp. piscium]
MCGVLRLFREQASAPAGENFSPPEIPAGAGARGLEPSPPSCCLTRPIPLNVVLSQGPFTR